MINKIFFSILLIFSLIFAQDYAWPTNTGKHLSSNFGEFRGNHFHMGLDIRTRGSIGHPLYAVSDGYIYRMATNFGGYGKALYLKTNDHRIAVYGHLSRFSKPLSSHLYELQSENHSYFVNKYFTQDEYPVKRGDIIGFSGNSGGSMGPHLHFEFRNDKDQPLNPMIHGFPLIDNVSPKFLDLAMIPVATGTHIDKSPIPQNYTPMRLSLNEYILQDTISIAGKFGIATRVIDKIQNASNSYQIEKLELMVDSVSTFSVQYDLLDFSEGKSIATIYGQPVNHSKNDDFQKLYRLESYPKLTIHNDYETGIVDLPKGVHKIEILAWDSAQNKSTLTFYVELTSSPQETTYKTSLNLIDYPIYNSGFKNFEPKLIQLENGAVFQLQDNINNSDIVMSFIEKDDALYTFPLIKIETYKYVSEMINPYLFQNIKSCGFLFYSDIIQKYEFDFNPTLILPNSTNTIFYRDSLCFVKGENVSYDTTLMWIVKQDNPSKTNSINRKSNVYELNPHGIPFKNKVEVSFAVTENSNLEQCAIYTFNKKKSKWNYVNSSIDTTTNSIIAKINKPNIFTVLEDTKPPWFNYTYPKNQQTYLKNTVKFIKIILDDDLSGINSSEDYLQVYLDGKRIWVAYQPVKKELSYKLREYLSIGGHTLLVKIQDRSGNSTSKSIKFFIE